MMRPITERKAGSMNARIILATIGAFTVLLALAGCSKTLTSDSVEDGIQSKLSGQVESATGSPITSASCPDDIEAKTGTKFTCTATLENGSEVQVAGDVANDDGQFNVTISPEELQSAAGG
jgi:hypothetical protein